MFRTKLQHLLGALGLAVLLGAAIAEAQESPPVRVRGTIEQVDGPNLVVKSRDGAELKVVLADNALVVAIAKASLADVKPGAFVGITGMPQADGTQRAVEVHVFPEAMRGTGEGHRPWDLGAGSTMTNGTVGTVTGTGGRSMTVKYGTESKTIEVTDKTAIVAFQPGQMAELKPGAHVIVFAQKAPDGTLTASRVSVGKDGLVPPM